MFGARYFGARYFGARYFGKEGPEPGDGRYFGGRYFGVRYYGPNYWGTLRDAPFEIEQTTGVSMAGVVRPTGNVVFPVGLPILTHPTLSGSINVNAVLVFDDNNDFNISPPIHVNALDGTVSVASSGFTYGLPAPGDGSYFGSRYFGSRYFGPRYWGTQQTFVLEATAEITGIFGVFGVTGSVESGIDVDPGELALSGEVGFPDVVTFTFDESRKNEAGRRKRRRHQVEVDGEVYEADSEEEALYILEKVKEEALATAQLAKERALKAEKRPLRKVMQDAKKALITPEIKAEDSINESAQVILAEIEELYRDTLQTIEIAALLRKQEEDEEEAILLMLV